MDNFYNLYTPPWAQNAGHKPGIWRWREILYQLLFSVWEISLPTGWSLTPFRYYLFGYGSVAVVYTKSLGWIYGPYGVDKVDWQYNPTHFLVSNTVLATTVKGAVGINGAILHISDSWLGLDPMINYYADLLDACDRGLKSNLRKIQYGHICGAFNAKDAGSIKAAFDKSETGEPIVIVNQSMLKDGSLDVSPVINAIQSSYMGAEILDTRCQILKDFLTKIGIRTVGIEKREHLLNQEIAENNDETGAAPYVIKSCLDDSLNTLHNLGVDIRIDPRYDYSGAGIGVKEGDDV